MATTKRLIAGLALLGLMTGVSACEGMRALEAQLEKNVESHPLGPLGPGLDMYAASEQIRAAQGR